MIQFGLRAHALPQQATDVAMALRSKIKGHRPCVVWFTGLSGAGKSTIANLVERKLVAQRLHTYLLDGDDIRRGLNKDLGFTKADRVENIRRAGEVSRLLVDAGLIVLCAFISPFRAERRLVRKLFEPREYLEVYVDAPLEVCRKRDPKGLYARVDRGELINFTGIDSPYEVPEEPDLVLRSSESSSEQLCDRVIAHLRTIKAIGQETEAIACTE